MIKRTLLAIPLLTAGFLFLAGTVVSHHHHGNHICYHKLHCESRDSSGTGGGERDGHDDGDGKSPCNCRLDEPVIVSSDRSDAGSKYLDNKSFQSGWNKAGGLLQNCRTDLPHPELSLAAFSRPALSPPVSCLTPPAGLRAPPSV